MKTCITIFGLCFLLAACSRGPSNSDIESAWKVEMEALGSSATFFTGGLEMVSAKKLNCTQVGDSSSYMCDVEFEFLDRAAIKTVKSVNQLRFVKGSDGWIVMKK
jgi:hypothetical protein